MRMEDSCECSPMLPVIIVGVLLLVSIGFVIGVSAEKFETNRELKSVGIDRIEHCHNSHSNWAEIVWIGDGK